MRNIGKKRKEEEGNGSLFKTERGKDFFTFQSRASVPQQKFLETGEPSALLQECSVLHECWAWVHSTCTLPLSFTSEE